jgi:hypothetical protein
MTIQEFQTKLFIAAQKSGFTDIEIYYEKKEVFGCQVYKGYAITEFYNLYPEENRLSSRCGEMEFLTTIKYIEKYLTSGMKILEIGAGQDGTRFISHVRGMKSMPSNCCRAI